MSVAPPETETTTFEHLDLEWDLSLAPPCWGNGKSCDNAAEWRRQLWHDEAGVLCTCRLVCTPCKERVRQNEKQAERVGMKPPVCRIHNLPVHMTWSPL